MNRREVLTGEAMVSESAGSGGESASEQGVAPRPSSEEG
jgi:hypothetical protein